VDIIHPSAQIRAKPPKAPAESPMKKKLPPTQRRPQDVMHRFDRLLATMAPKADPPTAPSPRAKPKSRRPQNIARS